SWPVGEEWLHQAWAGSYLPLLAVLDRLAAECRRDLVTLGVTPVLAAVLDDPYALREHHGWLGRWQLRAEELARDRDPALRATASEEFRAASRALELFETRWVHGGSAGLRPSRVTDPARPQKQPYRPDAAATAASRDAATFVAAVRDRLSALPGREPVAVVAWDTELFGHWWHEGPVFLEHVLRMLPEAG